MNVILWILIGLAIYLVGVVLSLATLAYLNKIVIKEYKEYWTDKWAVLSYGLLALLLALLLIGIVEVLSKTLWELLFARLYNWFYNKIDA